MLSKNLFNFWEKNYLIKKINYTKYMNLIEILFIINCLKYIKKFLKKTIEN